ncbi:hypothetical protein FUA48_04525 [Flavobacterium alkalisoli]|uniref:Phenylalanyl-tRNA synthetase subunit alpha n=1 Tax=Flavobacterium alkalisoli TaxID=2602769 RepID=A0A5B9FPG0_9FLAO|nr:hypothetical protein [Flavobacterium alkalisoli]QEE48864.1 hypothetical protein FUA48_04525 [Flavobacterium alkalisoli]
MKKDIKIPVVENVYMAVMQEWNDDFMEKTWYAYLINDSDDKLETVIVVSNATGVIDGEERKTSMMRHAFMEVPANSAVKVELLEETVLQLHNSFMVTFFKNNMLFDKNYVFIAGTINEEDTVELPVIAKDGILVK